MAIARRQVAALTPPLVAQDPADEPAKILLEPIRQNSKLKTA